MGCFEHSKHWLTNAADYYPSSRPASMSTDYLKLILTSKVYDVAVESPLELAPQVSARIHNQVWLKREDTKPVFSFTLRGAYNKMANFSPAELKRGVIAASAGNHAQGVARSAQRHGCRAVMAMPVSTPHGKGVPVGA